jgi:predicted ATP-dependent endonuclease of OLD family
MSLPLASRSKGFNWFFSFIVWFSKIQEDKDSNYILLLDEPGLNLHGKAQEDLLYFIEDLAKDYQIIYTTHSPFMVDSGKLHRVRTVVETDNGTKISDSIQEKDPDTLFPLQAALGYDIAQNLFISKNNLLIEGVSDLIYLTIMSNILDASGRTGLREDITLVPTGGLDKVTAFISLIRGQKLKIACLLDTFTDQKGKARLDNLIQKKIVQRNKICFFDEFSSIDSDQADIEDLFEKEEYLKIFNAAFSEHKDLKVKELDINTKQIISQINKALGIKNFNHYRPANELNKMSIDSSFFSSATLDRFERVFKTANSLI